MNPIVSIICPSYNSSSYIERTVRSVLAQTFNDWELIIVDDCSTDNSCAVVQKYISDERIKLVVNQFNLGGAGARNRAIGIAKGRFIAFLDSDDVWFDDKLDLQINYMIKHDIALCYGDYQIIDPEDRVIEDISTPKLVSYRSMLKHNYIACLTAIYDTDKVGKVYMPEIRKRQDFALWLKILKISGFAHRCNGLLGQYRVRPNSLSESKFDALKFYWIVLRDVASISRLSAFYYASSYLFIVFFKKKFPRLYGRVIKLNDERSH